MYYAVYIICRDRYVDMSIYYFIRGNIAVVGTT